MSTTRVPQTIPAFNIYINVTDNYLQALDPDSGLPNWQRLGLTLANSNEWNSKRIYWRDTLYRKYSNPTLSTSPVKAEVRHFMRNFRLFANPLLLIMSTNPSANNMDETEFNFKRFRSKRTFHIMHIEESCALGIHPIGLGSFHIKCRIPTAEGRPRKPHKADSVQLAYVIGDHPQGQPMDTMMQFISTKAIFNLNVGTLHSGKRIHIYARWYNTRHPQLAGTWSNLYSTVIL